MTTPDPRAPGTIRIEKHADTPARLTSITDAATGNPIRGVTNVNVDIDVLTGTRLTVTVIRPELTIDVDPSRVRWVGLEKVDTAALAAELARREEQQVGA